MFRRYPFGLQIQVYLGVTVAVLDWSCVRSCVCVCMRLNWVTGMVFPIFFRVESSCFNLSHVLL